MSIEPSIGERDPYLPPPAPTDNPPAKSASKAKQTLVIWLILVVLFVLVYSFLRTPSYPTPSTEHGSGFSLWHLVLPGLSVALLVWFFRQFRIIRRFSEDLDSASLAVADGDLERARQLFAELVTKSRGTVHQHTAQVNLAWTLQRMGRFEDEREVLLATEATPGLVYASEQRLYAAVYLARHFALCGDLDRAQRWLTDAQQRRARTARVNMYLVAQLRVVEAIILTRQERHGEALAILEKDWARIEASFTTLIMKHVLVLRGFLVTSAGGVRDEGLAAQWVAKLRPYRLDEIAYLWQAWPALRQWAETNRLIREPAAAQAS